MTDSYCRRKLSTYDFVAGLFSLSTSWCIMDADRCVIWPKALVILIKAENNQFLDHTSFKPCLE